MTVDKQENYSDYFELLGITVKSTDEDVKKAYRALAKQFHPDKNSEEGAEAFFKEIGSAYECLKTKSDRLIYNHKKNEKNEKLKAEKSAETKENEKSGSKYFYNDYYDRSTGAKERPTSHDHDPMWGFQFKYHDFDKRNEAWDMPRRKNGTSYEKHWTADSFAYQAPYFSSAFTRFIDDLFDISPIFEKFENVRARLNAQEFEQAPKMGFIGPGPSSAPGGAVTDTQNEGTTRSDKTRPHCQFPSEDELRAGLRTDIRLHCVFCGREFFLEGLKKHESYCKELNVQFKSVPQSAQNVLNDIKHARQATDSAQAAKERADQVREQKSTANANQVDDIECHWCGSQLNRRSMARHIKVCKLLNRHKHGAKSANTYQNISAHADDDDDVPYMRTSSSVSSSTSRSPSDKYVSPSSYPSSNRYRKYEYSKNPSPPPAAQAKPTSSRAQHERGTTQRERGTTQREGADPEPSRYSRTDPEPSRYSRAEPTSSRYSRAEPTSSKYGHSEPASSRYSRAETASSRYSRAEPTSSRYTRAEPEPSRYSRAEPEPSRYSRSSRVAGSSSTSTSHTNPPFYSQYGSNANRSYTSARSSGTGSLPRYRSGGGSTYSGGASSQLYSEGCPTCRIKYGHSAKLVCTCGSGSGFKRGIPTL